MTIRLALGFVVSAAFVGCASRSAPRPIVADAKRAESTRVLVDVSFFRLTPEAATRVLGPELDAQARTLVFDAARADTFFRDAKAQGSGVKRVDGAMFLAADGRRTVSDEGGAFHLDAEGLMERDAGEGIAAPKHRAFSVGIRPDVEGAWLKLDVKGVWTDEAWVGRSPRPAYLELAATSTVAPSGSTILLVSAMIPIGMDRPERYVLTVSPRVLGATEVASTSTGTPSTR